MGEFPRKNVQKRKTLETSIELELNVDGSGVGDIDTGIGFFDHMLQLFTRHGLFDIKLSCKGDLQVDGHHTVEDVGITLGAAFHNALYDKKGIKRYGSIILPMDETLVMCAVDLSGRPYLSCDVPLSKDKVGDFDTELLEEFLRAFAFNAGLNLHVKTISGTNCHHIIEAVFKAIGQALRQAVELDPRIKGALSTKGQLS